MDQVIDSSVPLYDGRPNLVHTLNSGPLILGLQSSQAVKPDAKTRVATRVFASVQNRDRTFHLSIVNDLLELTGSA